jgi:hypothetical protein
MEYDGTGELGRTPAEVAACANTAFNAIAGLIRVKYDAGRPDETEAS